VHARAPHRSQAGRARRGGRGRARQVEKAQAPYLCLDLSFQHALLTHGFKIEAASPVTLVKRVKYLGQEIEAAWPLGAAINLLSS
jgi:apyrase